MKTFGLLACVVSVSIVQSALATEDEYWEEETEYTAEKSQLMEGMFGITGVVALIKSDPAACRPKSKKQITITQLCTESKQPASPKTISDALAESIEAVSTDFRRQDLKAPKKSEESDAYKKSAAYDLIVGTQSSILNDLGTTVNESCKSQWADEVEVARYMLGEILGDVAVGTSRKVTVFVRQKRENQNGDGLLFLTKEEGSPYTSCAYLLESKAAMTYRPN